MQKIFDNKATIYCSPNNMYDTLIKSHMNNALYSNWYNYFFSFSQKKKINKLKLTTQAQISLDEIL